MSPATPFFYVLRIMPILEAGGKLIKIRKGETPGATNIDGYDTTKFEIRISARNMKAGNIRIYNYLSLKQITNYIRSDVVIIWFASMHALPYVLLKLFFEKPISELLINE